MSAERLLELHARYTALLHAIQSGVMMTINYDPKFAAPKDLRTGIDSAFVNQAAITRLLVDKGIITDEEYLLALIDAAQQEKARYEAELSARLGGEIHLA